MVEDTLSNARRANSKKWQIEIRQFLPVKGGAGIVRICHHFLSVALKEAMLLPSFSCPSHHQSMPLCRNEIVILKLLELYTQVKRLSSSNSDNSVAFADSFVQSWCIIRWIHDGIRWIHDGIARASRSRVALLRQSGSFLFPSCYLREAKKARWHRWLHEVKTKMTRFATMALRRANRTHEFNTIMNLRKVFGHFFGMPKILPSLTKLLPKPEKLNRWSYDGFRCPHEWPDVYTIRPEFEHFHNRVSIWCQVRDSVTPA